MQHWELPETDASGELPDKGFLRLAAAILQLPEEMILAKMLSRSEHVAEWLSP